MLLLLLQALTTQPAIAQPFCGTDLLHARQMQQNKPYAQQAQNAASSWRSAQQLKKYQKKIITGTDTAYEIPVVIHIIHSGEAVGTTFNPSDGDIHDLMDYLNEVYQTTWHLFPDETSGGTKIPIYFKLAQRDPDCNPTTGINRIDGSILANYKDYGVNYDNTTPAPSDSAVKYLSKWPSGDYYNIWIVKYIDGPSGATAGAYAYYPFSTDLDGTVMAAIYTYPIFSGTYYSAIPHELGHALLLQHTFQGDDGGTTCPDDIDCTIDGDGICDTEPHIRESGCPFGVNTCTAMYYGRVRYNIMNYTSCPDRFTPDQKERALFALTRLRPGLISSLGATAPDPAFVPPPATSCIPGILHKDNDTDAGPRQISFADISPSSYGYTGDSRKAYIDRTCTQQAAHLLTGNSYSLDITTGPNIENVSAWIDYNNDGTFGSGELVMTHIGSVPDETHNAAVFIPVSGVATGKTLRMRIIADMSGLIPILDPCADLLYGQTEDYSVVITKSVSTEDALNIPGIEVFPNPSNSTIQIKAPGEYYTEIHSIEGKLLLRSRDKKEIDISSFAPGMYLVLLKDVQDNHIMTTVKLLRQ